MAQQFAGNRGRVWTTDVGRARSHGSIHISRLELIGLLKGKGKGAARWSSAYDIMQARRNVERHSEHLLSYRQLADTEAASYAAAGMFEQV